MKDLSHSSARMGAKSLREPMLEPNVDAKECEMAEQNMTSEELDAQRLMAAVVNAKRNVALFPTELRQQLEFGFCRAEEEGQSIARHGVWSVR